MMKKESVREIRRLRIAGELDRHTAEALQLEIRRVSRPYPVDIKEIRIEKLDQDSSA